MSLTPVPWLAITVEQVLASECKNLITFNAVDKEVLVKPDLVSTEEMATETDAPHITYSEASMMTNGEDGRLKMTKKLYSFILAFPL